MNSDDPGSEATAEPVSDGSISGALDDYVVSDATHAAIAAAELYASSRAFAVQHQALSALANRLGSVQGDTPFGQALAEPLASALALSGQLKQALDVAANTARGQLSGDVQSLPPIPSVQRTQPPEAFRTAFTAIAAEGVQIDNVYTLLAGVWGQTPVMDRWRYADHMAIEIAGRDGPSAEALVVASYLTKPVPDRALRAATQLFKFGSIRAASHFLDIADADPQPISPPVGELRLSRALWRDGIALAPRGQGALSGAVDDLAYVASSSLPHSTAGYTVRTHALLKAYRALGQTVTCYTRPGYPWDRPALPESEATGDVSTVDGIDYVHSDIAGITDHPEAMIDRMAEALRRRFLVRRPRVVQAASNSRNALPALIAARSLGIPFVYEVRGLWEITASSSKPGWERTERYRFQQDLEAFVAREADHVFTITRGVADEMIAMGVDPGRVSLLSNGVDPDAFLPRRKDPDLVERLGLGSADLTIVYAGSLLAYEGLDDVISAAHRLVTAGRRVKVVLVGDGVVRSSLQDQAVALGMAEHVHFVGRVAPDEVASYIELADVVVIARKPERVCEIVSPLKPFEAMAQGKLVVVSDLPALTEIIIDRERGRVCKPADPDDLASVLGQIMDAPAAHRTMAARGRAWAIGTCSWSSLARKSIEVHRDLSGVSAQRGEGAP